MRLVALVAGGMMMFVAVNYILHEHSVVIYTPVNPMFTSVSHQPVAQFQISHMIASTQPTATEPSGKISQPVAAAIDDPISSGQMPIPREEAFTPWSGPDQLVLWENPAKAIVEYQDGIEHLIVQIDPQHLAGFRPGQTLVMPLPDGGPEVQALITSTFNDAMGTHNWQAQVQNDLPSASVLITQGPEQTHIALFTEKGSYTLVADNKTGRATLVDEGKLIARQVEFEDGIVLAEHPDFTPPIMP